MLIAKVIGTTVASIKDEKLEGRKLLICRETDETGKATGKPYVAPHKLKWFRETKFRQAMAHAVDRGFAPAQVVWLFSFGGLSMVAGNVFGGWLSDRLGSGWVFAAGSLVAIAGIGCFAVTRGPQDLPLLVLYTVAGFGFGMRIALLSTIPAAVFSGPSLGTILGVVQAGGGLGGAIGPYLGGWLFDVTGSYRLAFLAAAVAVAGSSVAAWLAARPVPAARYRA